MEAPPSEDEPPFAEVLPPPQEEAPPPYGDDVDAADEADSDEGPEDDWRLLGETEGPRRTNAATEASVRPPGAAVEGAFSEELPVEERPLTPPPLRRRSPPPAWVDEAAPPLGSPTPPPPAPERDGPAPLISSLDDLDALIEQLERAPRIRPDAHLDEESDEADEFGAGEVVSETLARIYEGQRQFADAARAYEQLAREHPHRAEEFAQKADEMRRRAGA